MLVCKRVWAGGGGAVPQRKKRGRHIINVFLSSGLLSQPTRLNVPTTNQRTTHPKQQYKQQLFNQPTTNQQQLQANQPINATTTNQHQPVSIFL